MLAATVGGTVDGGISAIVIMSGKPALGKAITGTLGGNQENVDFLDLGVSVATGTVVNRGSEFLENQGKSIIKDAINSESTIKTLWKEAKASIKNSGKKPTPAELGSVHLA